MRRALAAALPAVLAACAGTEGPAGPGQRPLSADEGRALVRRALPDSVRDPAGWSTDIYAAFTSLGINPSPDNVCAAVAVIGQESGFQADPPVPGLAQIARKEIDRRRESAGIPKLALDAALALSSSNGKTYGERLDAVKTEQQLSELYEDFIGRVPFGKSLLADRNPVRTGGAMQVSIPFAEAFSAENPYPYPVTGNIRHEVFSRRGGVYFGIAHLLDYPANYPRQLYRFADYNAGRHASRNAAFQSAVTQTSGIPLDLDGDLLHYEHGEAAREPGSTELATRVLARRIDLDNQDIRRDLLQEKTPGFGQTRLYIRVFTLADDASGKPAPRAIVPRIALHSPKITRELTTEWFAGRVDSRYQDCLRRVAR
ncbi:MAG: DUF1615 domain-containing protein [Casimicrobiaceae bacterium]